MAEAAGQARGESAQRITKAYHYLYDNRFGLEDYRLKLGEAGTRLRRTGAMEGNVDKLVVRRMKNQGMSWSLKGIRRLLCVRFLVLEGKLTSWLSAKQAVTPQISIPIKKVHRIVTSFRPKNLMLGYKLGYRRYMVLTPLIPGLKYLEI